MDPRLEGWLTVQEAAENLGVTKQALYKRLREGKLRAVEFKGITLTRGEWLTEGKVGDMVHSEETRPVAKPQPVHSPSTLVAPPAPKPVAISQPRDSECQPRFKKKMQKAIGRGER